MDVAAEKRRQDQDRQRNAGERQEVAETHG
jgi:hypothetical protein